MLTKLTLGEKLKDLRIEKGFKNTDDLAKAVNIPKITLNDYENDEKNQDVRYSNLVILAKFYDVSLDWLLGITSSKNPIWHNDLGFTDDAVLKMKDINMRMLNEIIENPNFADLMADIEICVDSIASSQLSSFNTITQIGKDKIKGEHNPSDQDYIMRTLERAKINEDKYFQGIIHQDIDLIVSDIRELHKNNKKDTSVASDENLAVNFVLDILEKINAMENKSDPVQVKMQFIPLIFGVQTNRLTQLERTIFENLIKKGNRTWKRA